MPTGVKGAPARPDTFQQLPAQCIGSQNRPTPYIPQAKNITRQALHLKRAMRCLEQQPRHSIQTSTAQILCKATVSC